MDKFPKPYQNSVPKDPENERNMEYVPFKNMGIGARKSGMPSNASDGPKGLDHVGGSATGNK